MLELCREREGSRGGEKGRDRTYREEPLRGRIVVRVLGKGWEGRKLLSAEKESGLKEEHNACWRAFPSSARSKGAREERGIGQGLLGQREREKISTQKKAILMGEALSVRKVSSGELCKRINLEAGLEGLCPANIEKTTVLGGSRPLPGRKVDGKFFRENFQKTGALGGEYCSHCKKGKKAQERFPEGGGRLITGGRFWGENTSGKERKARS